MNRCKLVFVLASVAVLPLAFAEYASAAEEPVIKVVAKKFDYAPSRIKLKKGVPVTIELTSADVVMGFNAPDFNVRADVPPGKVVRVRIVPDKTGTFTFFCDVFCGSGHEDMSGVIEVE